ncbi:MAG: hypothetical protein JKY37_21305 [Nannocystaceae bacterium]|nr:hypothetical protein [Nannocystaceae bacterium]
MVDVLVEWAAAHDALLLWIAGLSMGLFVGTILIVPVLLARMRTDYFVEGRHPPAVSKLHPMLRWAARIAKNLVGAGLVLAGTAMLVLPGQGILTILLGLAMLDVPGKRRLEQRLVRRARVRRSIDWVRRAAGRPPLEFDEHLPASGQPGRETAAD